MSLWLGKLFNGSGVQCQSLDHEIKPYKEVLWHKFSTSFMYSSSSFTKPKKNKNGMIKLCTIVLFSNFNNAKLEASVHASGQENLNFII